MHPDPPADVPGRQGVGDVQRLAHVSAVQPVNLRGAVDAGRHARQALRRRSVAVAPFPRDHLPRQEIRRQRAVTVAAAGLPLSWSTGRHGYRHLPKPTAVLNTQAPWLLRRH